MSDILAQQSVAISHSGARAGAERRSSVRKAVSPADDPLVALVLKQRIAKEAEFERCFHAFGVLAKADEGSPADYLFLNEYNHQTPSDAFERLRWGGQVVYVSRRRADVETAAKAFETWRLEQPGQGQGAWKVEQGREGRYLFSFKLPGTHVYFMAARKVMLVPPGKSSDRFTYHVHLDRPVGAATATDGTFEVVKEVPTVERVTARLREKFPDADEETLRRRARKFTEKIFPVFLTRETAILKLLQRDLPRKFRNRVPTVISAETDANGYTRVLRMNWLRNARPVMKHGGKSEGRALTQLEFAQQAAELLAALHDEVGIIHLDLRLDNVVITENGVGFVDFGSAVRVGEEFPEASLLSNLFDEMMRTSQIQRMLGKMTRRGEVTSEEIVSCHHRVDKAVDFFYLAVQINAPLTNPDFAGLVTFDKKSAEAVELKKLTDEILRPTKPEASRYTSARDILRGVEEIAGRLRK